MVGKLPLVPLVGRSVREPLQEGESKAEGVSHGGGEDRAQLEGVPCQGRLAGGNEERD